MYLFGSVDSLLNADMMTLFKRLNRLPFDTYINIGLESHDQATWFQIGKPVTAEKVSLAFDRMGEINHTFPKIEMTGNFIMDDHLPPPTSIHAGPGQGRISHPRSQRRYLSACLRFGKPSREVLYDFYRLKTASRLPSGCTSSSGCSLLTSYLDGATQKTLAGM